MKITRCHICDKPFFPNPSATDFAQGFDPNACPQCNANAIKNSQIVDNKTYAITQALAEERERMQEEIEKVKFIISDGDIKREVVGLEDLTSTLTSSLDKPLTK